MSSTASRPTVEVLLVGTTTDDGHTECIVDARTNIELWSSRGAESGARSCGGAATSKLFGREHLITLLEKQPSLTIVPLHVRRKNLDRLSLPQVATDFAVHRDGQILSVACADKVFTWILYSGQLKSIDTMHLQPISCIEFIASGQMLCSAGADGNVCIRSLQALLAPDDKGVYRRVIHAHTTAISAMQVCSVSGADAGFRVYTAAVDRSVKILDPLSSETLMTIHLDVEPLCLSVDTTESRIAVGCASGEVAIIGVHQEPYEFERHVSLRKTYDTKEQRTQRALFAPHNALVRQVAFSADAQLLVSGDENGTLRYFHVKSGQIEREVDMKGKAIRTLRFISPTPSLLDNSIEPPIRRLQLSPLERTVNSNRGTVMTALNVPSDIRKRLDSPGVEIMTLQRVQSETQMTNTCEKQTQTDTLQKNDKRPRLSALAQESNERLCMSEEMWTQREKTPPPKKKVELSKCDGSCRRNESKRRSETRAAEVQTTSDTNENGLPIVVELRQKVGELRAKLERAYQVNKALAEAAKNELLRNSACKCETPSIVSLNRKGTVSVIPNPHYSGPSWEEYQAKCAVANTSDTIADRETDSLQVFVTPGRTAACNYRTPQLRLSRLPPGFVGTSERASVVLTPTEEQRVEVSTGTALDVGDVAAADAKHKAVRENVGSSARKQEKRKSSGIQERISKKRRQALRRHAVRLEKTKQKRKVISTL